MSPRGGPRPGAGRPPGEVTRPHRVMVRLTEDERGWLQARAAADRVTVSEEIRRILNKVRGEPK